MRDGNGLVTPEGGRERYILVPFQAMEAAGVDFDTVKPIEVEEDHFENVVHETPRAPIERLRNLKALASETATRTGDRPDVRAYEVEHRGFRFQAALRRETTWTNSTTGVVQTWRPWNSTGWTAIDRWQWVNQVHVWAPDIDGIWAWRAMQGLPDGGFKNWMERVHHLGACLFSARSSEDGRRHKYVSSFDRHENPPLYFLAQLPDRSGAATLVEAIEALKPPLVKQAEQEKRRVVRQGDIFAVETSLTDEEVYSQARARVRRDVVLQEFRSIQEMGQIIPPGPGEVVELIDCPCGCGHKRRHGFGPRARNTLSIYRTGHTADEVVRMRDGSTMIRGHMYHDPFLEDPTRRNADHRPQELNDSSWWLCVRNTVPRRRVRPQPVEEQEQDQEELAA